MFKQWPYGLMSKSAYKGLHTKLQSAVAAVIGDN